MDADSGRHSSKFPRWKVSVAYSPRTTASGAKRTFAAMLMWATVTDGRESRARSCLGGTLFYENSDRSEYTGEVFGGLTYVKFDSWEIGIVPIEEGSLRQ